MPQFFINKENISSEGITITDKSDIAHISRVLRLSKGDILILVGKDGFVYEAEINNIQPDSVETKIIDKYLSNKKLSINITLVQSILKSQKQDFIIQKSSELGVRTIIPTITQNTVVKFSSDRDKASKIQRWQRISYEASKQCKKIEITEIKEIITFNEIFNLNSYDIKIACVEREASFSIKSFLSQTKNLPHQNILLVIGPEGGWSDAELDLFNKYNFASVSLGNLILRAETAAVTAISDIIYEYEM